MGALPELIAHGGIGGAIVEALVGLAVLGVFFAVWLRERKARSQTEGPARLRDEELPPS